MRQMLFLLASAMLAAFSLSWASPGNVDHEYLIPDSVIFPMNWSSGKAAEISATVTLKDSCEKVEELGQETRDHRVIFFIRISHSSDSFCLQQLRPNVVVNFTLESGKIDPSGKVDFYFREDEENLKYFGSAELK